MRSLRGVAWFVLSAAAGGAGCEPSSSAADDDPAPDPLGPSCTGVAYPDEDGDGFGDGLGSTETICAGGEVPAGYRTNGTDCDDTDPALSVWYALDDLDGDGQTLCGVEVELVCGALDERPPGSGPTTTCPGDCDDADPERSWLHYEDQDGDGFGWPGGAAVCAGSEAPVGFAPGAVPDCDDERADVNAFALEQWNDTVDSDCDGFLSPYGCDDESCEPELGPLPVDADCESADLRIDVSAVRECYSVSWVVVVGNQGSEAAPGFTLSIDGWREPISYSVEDPLAPSEQRAYPISNRWLEGDLLFALVADGADCDAGNDVLAVSALGLDCTR